LSKESILLSLTRDDGIPEPIARDIVDDLISDDSDSTTDSNDGDSEDSDNSDSDSNDDDSSLGVDLPPLVKKRRRYFGHRDREAANWYLRYLKTDEQRAILRDDETHRDTKEFRANFRVDFQIFERLVHMADSRFWYDSTQTDAKLRKCSSLQLLVLGCLHVLGTSASQIVVQTNTNIDQEVHRQFFLLWLRHMHAIKNEFIFMPRNAEELEIVSSDYHSLGLPGCCGSADGVHIGWDRCPAQLLHLYKGKESYPSIAYNVVVTNRRFIQSVSQGHPGARNDKHMSRLDDVLMLLQHGPSFLHSSEWNAFTLDSQIKEETGYYLIVDGGYLRWPTLICPVKDDECFLLWSKMVEGARKDA
jgi:hypothetical protein